MVEFFTNYMQEHTNTLSKIQILYYICKLQPAAGENFSIFTSITEKICHPPLLRHPPLFAIPLFEIFENCYLFSKGGMGGSNYAKIKILTFWGQIRSENFLRFS